MYLKELYLQNIKTYKDLRFNFTASDGEPRKWTGFLGANGTGKSIILDCIAVALAGESALRTAFAVPREWVRFGEEYGIIEATIDVTDEDSTDKNELLLRYFVTGKNGADIEGRYFQAQGIYVDDESKDRELYAKITDNPHGFLVCGYGPFRRPPRGTEDSFGSKREMRPRSSRIVSMFDESSPISELESWLIELDYDVEKERHGAKELQETATKFMKKILPDVSYSDINKDKQVMFETPDGLSPLSELSDGYRSVIAWSANLVQHMFGAYPHLPSPTNGTGVVLVDEIDVHLHPNAQRKIINHLRELFPNIQFILSSHSPFVAQSLKKGEIFYLLRDKEQKQTIIEPIEKSFEGWRVDQILTSEAFGLKTSRDEDTEQELKEYEKLVIDIELGKADKKDEIREKLLQEELFSKIPFSGETSKIRDLEKKISEYRAELEQYKKNDPSR